ncbi:MAG: hypothetical protein PHW75_02935, partial [Patescibacteria group bacterium]|nr:hypothetical protein [Patescibacteria group bacterium]
SEVVEVGKKYKFRVVSVDIDNHKLALSLKKAEKKAPAKKAEKVEAVKAEKKTTSKSESATTKKTTKKKDA